jgi:hypothetical protein
VVKKRAGNRLVAHQDVCGVPLHYQTHVYVGGQKTRRK